MKKFLEGTLMFAAIAGLTVSTARVASADQVFSWTNDVQGQLVQTDVTTGVQTVIDTVPVGGFPDSLVYTSSGNILYTVDGGGVAGAGQLREYNTTTNVDSLVRGGLSSSYLDLQLLPDGTVAVS